ncbi:MAG: hypothetical protein NZO58_06155 [Gemmataceae bacterium]|nr:hypothetical protein [Gemmataceae bacterium]
MPTDTLPADILLGEILKEVQEQHSAAQPSQPAWKRVLPVDGRGQTACGLESIEGGTNHGSSLGKPVAGHCKHGYCWRGRLRPKQFASDRPRRNRFAAATERRRGAAGERPAQGRTG